VSIRGRTGLFGSGKTYGMVQELYHVRQKNPDVRVLTNLSRLNLPGRPVELLGDQEDEAAQMRTLLAFSDGYLALDEVGVYLPARRWARVADELMAKWQQMRKDKIELRWTCIRPQQVIKDLRDITWETAWCSSYRMLGFFVENWYSYTAVQDARYFMYRNISLLRGKRMREVYDSMGKVGGLLATGPSERAPSRPASPPPTPLNAPPPYVIPSAFRDGRGAL